MCIICIKNRGVTIPHETLKQMFTNNPDGAGVCWYTRAGGLQVSKGYFTFTEFERLLRDEVRTAPAIIHCRISTSGAIDAGNCHPWIVSGNVRFLTAPDVSARTGFALAHNGIFRDITPRTIEGHKLSDTGIFVHDVIAPLAANTNGGLMRDDMDPLLNALCGSFNRLAIMDAGGHIKRYGSGWVEDGKLVFSNDTYKPIKAAPRWTYARRGLYDDDDDFSGGYYGGGGGYTYYSPSAAPRTAETHPADKDKADTVPAVTAAPATPDKDKVGTAASYTVKTEKASTARDTRLVPFYRSYKGGRK